MSQSEDFLSRWSRRKQQAAKEASLPAKEPERTAADGQAVAGEGRPSATVDAAQPEPIFDLSKLPSLDSIGPDTDMSMFMQAGVPAPLVRAALRRAWSADPAIRDFIGLSENSWDFTKPDAISGFGPLLPIDDVKRLLAQVLKDEVPVDADGKQAALQQEPVGKTAQLSVSQESETDKDIVVPQADCAVDAESLVRCTNTEPPPQETQSARNDVSSGSRRRHGGALPG